MLQSQRIIAGSLVERLSRTGSMRRGGELPTLSGVTTDFIRGLILYQERTTLDETIRVIAEELERDPLHGEIRARRPVPAGHPESSTRSRRTCIRPSRRDSPPCWHTLVRADVRVVITTHSTRARRRDPGPKP